MSLTPGEAGPSGQIQLVVCDMGHSQPGHHLEIVKHVVGRLPGPLEDEVHAAREVQLLGDPEHPDPGGGCEARGGARNGRCDGFTQ